jgi:hypothetical protein
LFCKASGQVRRMLFASRSNNHSFQDRFSRLKARASKLTTPVLIEVVHRSSDTG